MTEDEFDAAAQDSYKAALADMFTGVTPDMITLSVASGSIVVTADIATTYSPAEAQTMVVSVLAAATPTSLSTSLGVSVTAVEAPVVAVVAISSPPPSPPPPPPPEGSSILGIIIIAIIAVVTIGFIIGFIVATKRKPIAKDGASPKRALEMAPSPADDQKASDSEAQVALAPAPSKERAPSTSLPASHDPAGPQQQDVLHSPATRDLSEPDEWLTFLALSANRQANTTSSVTAVSDGHGEPVVKTQIADEAAQQSQREQIASLRMELAIPKKSKDDKVALIAADILGIDETEYETQADLLDACLLTVRKADQVDKKVLRAAEPGANKSDDSTMGTELRASSVAPSLPTPINTNAAHSMRFSNLTENDRPMPSSSKSNPGKEGRFSRMLSSPSLDVGESSTNDSLELHDSNTKRKQHRREKRKELTAAADTPVSQSDRPLSSQRFDTYEETRPQVPKPAAVGLLALHRAAEDNGALSEVINEINEQKKKLAALRAEERLMQREAAMQRRNAERESERQQAKQRRLNVEAGAAAGAPAARADAPPFQRNDHAVRPDAPPIREPDARMVSIRDIVSIPTDRLTSDEEAALIAADLLSIDSSQYNGCHEAIVEACFEKLCELGLVDQPTPSSAPSLDAVASSAAAVPQAAVTPVDDAPVLEVTIDLSHLPHVESGEDHFECTDSSLVA